MSSPSSSTIPEDTIITNHLHDWIISNEDGTLRAECQICHLSVVDCEHIILDDDMCECGEPAENCVLCGCRCCTVENGLCDACDEVHRCTHCMDEFQVVCGHCPAKCCKACVFICDECGKQCCCGHSIKKGDSTYPL